MFSESVYSWECSLWDSQGRKCIYNCAAALQWLLDVHDNWVCQLVTGQSFKLLWILAFPSVLVTLTSMGSVTADNWECWVNKPVWSAAKWEQWEDSESWNSLLRASFDLIRCTAWRGIRWSHWISQFKWSNNPVLLYYPVTLTLRVGGLAIIYEKVANQTPARHPVLTKFPRDRGSTSVVWSFTVLNVTLFILSIYPTSDIIFC